MTAHNSCPKCVAQAIHIERRSAFTYHDAALRTNQSFRLRYDEEFHHILASQFERITNLDMIISFPIDYMHACLLGVMKKLCELWFGEKSLYSASTKARISDKIRAFMKTQPTEFQRHLRGLNSMRMWKANELRTFLLFIGPSVLKDEITPEQYNNFLLFHVAMTILINRDFSTSLNHIAKILIKTFVTQVAEIYGPQYVTYNFHLITHICDDVLRHGSLDSFSAFKFESYIGKMKTLVKSANNPIAQIHNRLSEMSKFSQQQNRVNRVSYEMEDQDKNDQKKYNKLRIHDRYLRNNEKDCFVLLENSVIAKIEYFFKGERDNIMAQTLMYEDTSNIFDLPIHSREINCFKIQKANCSKAIINVKKFMRKMYSTPCLNDGGEIWLYPLNEFME
jgi:hypothetical protein